MKFAEDVFKLTPQKLKEGISPDLDADYYSPIHFEPFVKGKNITWQQWLIFRAVEWAVLDKAPRFISVASGRGTGKSSSLAMLIIWFLLLHKDAQIPCTAPTADQLHDVLWKEIALWARRMPEALREKLQIQSDVVRLVESPMTWFARARTAKKENPEALSGMHSDDMMYVADESCFDDQTEILTDSGWKLFENLERTDRVLTMNPKSHIAEYEVPRQRIMCPYKGKMYKYDYRGGDFVVSPKHELYYRCTGGNWIKKMARDAPDTMTMSVTVDWKGKSEDKYLVPKCHLLRVLREENLEFDMSDWLSFLGWYLAEGHVAKRITKRGKIRHNSCHISQRSIRHRDEIRKLLIRMGVSYSENQHGFTVNSTHIATHLSTLGMGFQNKRVPRYVMSLPPEQIKIFLHSFMCGDGYMKGGQMILYSSNELLTDDLHELCILAGFRATKKMRKLKGKKNWIFDHWATSSCDGYYVTASEPTHMRIEPKRKMETVDYDGMIYCVTTNNGLIFTRRNGFCFWSGNSGIVQEVFDIAVGSMTNKNALFLLTSNPTRLTGYFFESHHKNKHLFQTIHLNSEQSPIVTEEFIKRMESEYGKDTDAYAVHVLGRFPSAEAGQYISTELFESAVAREVPIIPHAPKILGVDIARMGDDATVATERKGAYSELKFELRGNDTMAVTGRIIAEIEHAREYGKPYDFVCVDSIGIGAGVVDRLREQKYDVMAVNVAEKPRIKGVKNLRMELWKRMRDWLSEGHVSKEYVDITHPFYQFDSSGRIILESKKDMKSRGLASCDYGDSLALTFCPLQTVAKQYAKKKEKKIFDEPLKGWRAKLRGVRSV